MERNKGPLVRVERTPGAWVTMYRADAQAAGLLPEQKHRWPAGDKMLMPEEDKLRHGPVEDKAGDCPGGNHG